MNVKLTCIIFFLVFTSAVFSSAAQETGIIRGVIMEKGTQSRVAAAEIYNKKNKVTVRSDDFGLFQINAHPGDTLLVYKQSYADAQHVIPSVKDVVIYLDRGTTLAEVNIYGKSKRQELNEVKQDFRDKGSYYGGKPPVLSYIFTPLTAIYELFGRTPKNARRFNKYYNTELQQTQIDGYFNESLIKQHTDLSGKELEDFMLNYRPEYETAKNWSEYDALKYIRECYKKYKDTLNK
ncbi:hypothetical protein [Pedobacter sp.]|uniref:hypothetical protein n=1 Tax=Pedobacter sp. TaxID=1411316 RepID=UPI003D7F576A